MVSLSTYRLGTMLNLMIVNFFTRKSTVSDSHGSVYVQVTINKERLTLGAVAAVAGLQMPKTILIDLRHWDAKEERVRKASPQAATLNRAIDVVRAKLKKLLDQHEGYDLVMNAREVKQLFIGDGQLRPTFKTLMDAFLEERAKIGTKYSTLETYGYKFRPITAFLMEKGLFARPADEFTPEHLKQFRVYMIASRGNKPRSADKACQVLKTLMIWAKSSGKIRQNLIADTLVKVDKTPNLECLTQEEVKRVGEAELMPELRAVADCFIFACYTGLAYQDLRDLPASSLQQVEGEWCIVGKRQKTGTDFTIPVTRPVWALIEKYGSVKMPVLSLGRYNKYLKQIIFFLGIKKRITTHTARKTFCDWCINELNLSEEATIVAMGQKDASELKPYRKTRPKRLLNEFPKDLLNRKPGQAL